MAEPDDRGRDDAARVTGVTVTAEKDGWRAEHLPTLLRTLAFTVTTAFRTDPLHGVVAMALSPLGWCRPVLLGLWLKLLIDAAFGHATVLMTVAISGLVLTDVMAWVSGIVGRRLGQTFRERAGIALEGQLIRTAAGMRTLEHLERPEYVDRLDPVRKEAWIVHWTLESLAETLGAVVRMALMVGLLASISPAMLLLPVFGIPALLVGRTAALRERAADEALGEARRRQRHLVTLATDAPPGKEIRVFGLQERLLDLSRQTWRREHDLRARVAWIGTGWQSAASAAFAVGFVGALALVAHAVATGAASVGDLALALVLAATMSSSLGLTVHMFEWLVSCLAVGARLLWLVDEAAKEERRTRRDRTDEPAPVSVPPKGLRHGIELRDVTFRYPGTSCPVLVNVSLTLPAGRVVALVGDNGAGKTTIVKLLAGMYEPTAGTILVDGVPLDTLDLAAWRARCTGAFQDHARFELTVREAVGLGDLSKKGPDMATAVDRALAGAGATELTSVLANGLDTQLGATWPGGTDLSGGQWQKVALARGLMRADPLLTVLDEPTASLDARTEDALFARYAERARRNRAGNGVTLVVSHRFSTVRGADHIVVLAGGQISEQGSHETLMRDGGTYAELYEIQARGYR